MLYHVKVNLSLHYDRNFEVEAKDEKEAEQKGKAFAWKIAYLENNYDWTFQESDVSIAYVEER